MCMESSVEVFCANVENGSCLIKIISIDYISFVLNMIYLHVLTFIRFVNTEHIVNYLL